MNCCFHIRRKMAECSNEWPDLKKGTLLCCPFSVVVCLRSARPQHLVRPARALSAERRRRKGKGQAETRQEGQAASGRRWAAMENLTGSQRCGLGVGPNSRSKVAATMRLQGGETNMKSKESDATSCRSLCCVSWTDKSNCSPREISNLMSRGSAPCARAMRCKTAPKPARRSDPAKRQRSRSLCAASAYPLLLEDSHDWGLSAPWNPLVGLRVVHYMVMFVNRMLLEAD